MYEFMFENPTKIYFGEKERKKLGKIVSKYGSRALLVYGGNTIKNIGLYDEIVELLESENIEIVECGGVKSNPRHSKVNEGALLCKEKNIDVLVAVGGGTVIDCAKAIAVSCFYDGDCWDLITKKVSIEKALPVISVPTIAGTGSEMNNSCVISNEIEHAKRGFTNELLRPKASFLDPVLTFSVNQYQTACGAVDIISHILDTAYMVKRNKMSMLNDIMESLCRTVLHFAPIAVNEPENYEARANLMWASAWGLNGFLKNGVKQLAVCHALEHELSAIYDITHGLGMAITMPRYIEYILDEETAEYFESLAKNVFGVECEFNALESSKKMIKKMETFFYKELKLPSRLSEVGIDDKYFTVMANNICWGGTLPGLKVLSVEDVENIFRMCL